VGPEEFFIVGGKLHDINLACFLKELLKMALLFGKV
jgi:hypothetical protein